MYSAYVWPRLVQGQGHNLRLNFVWLYFVFALYLLNPWWVLQITLHKCQLWWDDVQCLCLTKVGLRSSSHLRLNIVWLFFVSALYLWTPGGFYKLFCTNVSYDGTMCSAYVWPVPMFDQDRLKVKATLKWLYFVSALYLLNPWWD